MKARVAENRSRVILAEAEVPLAMAEAFKAGNLYGHPSADDGRTPGNGRGA
jgi:uncharacterized protein YqfA (UPF0365 family)